MRTKAFTFQSPYGAFELKRCYQKYMSAGTLMSCFMAVAAVLAMQIGGSPQNAAKLRAGLGLRDSAHYCPFPAPIIHPQTGGTLIKHEDIPLPLIGTPKPIDEEGVKETNVLTSNLEKEKLANIGSDSGLMEFGFGDDSKSAKIGEIFPDPEKFIPYDEEPQLISSPPPAYPEMARKAGIEGSVWIKVLIDKEGNVRDAVVIRESGVNAGFEQAALNAAHQRKYKPAMQNKQPVPVWIAYKVKFQLN